MTRADKIRGLSDEALARMLVAGNGCALFCSNEARCAAALMTDGGIPDEWCMECALRWLHSDGEVRV